MNKKSTLAGVIVAAGGLIGVAAIWVALQFIPALDSCLDSGGRWNWRLNQCVCGQGYALDGRPGRCYPTLTRQILESMVIVRGQCKRIVSTFQSDFGAHGNKLEIDISAVIAGYGTQAAGRGEYLYYGDATAGDVCTGNDIVVVLRENSDGRGGYIFSLDIFFPVRQMPGSAEEFVTVDDPTGFSLYSHKDGREYTPDWTKVPYEDFVFTLRKISKSDPRDFQFPDTVLE